MNRKAVLIFITLLSSLALSACGSSGGGGGVPAVQPTNLDPSFGTNGKVTTNFLLPGTNNVTGNALAIQGDSKIVVAGIADSGNTSDFALARYNTDGSLDASFNGPLGICIIGIPCNGILTTDFNGDFDDATAMVIQANGKIIVAGVTLNGIDSDFALARYNTDGSLDTSFGPAGTGKVTTPFYTGQIDYASAIALQTNGKIVVAGSAFGGTNNDFALARYNTNGTLDTSFNYIGSSCLPGFICNGKQRTDFNSDFDYAEAVVIQANGKIVVVGSAGNGTDIDFALARYNSNGSLDTTFGTAGTGKVTTSFYSGQKNSAKGVILQPDGKIVVAGYANDGTNDNFALARYNTNGTLDTSFNDRGGLCIIGAPCSGQVVTDINGIYSKANSLALDAGSKIVVAGIAGSGFAVARYNIDGSMDISFGAIGTGLAGTDFGGLGASSGATAVAIQSNGKIVAAGTLSNMNNVFALARYLP